MIQIISDIPFPTSELQQIITPEMAWRYRIIPGGIDEETLLFYNDNTENVAELKEELEALLGKAVHLTTADSLCINKCLASLYRKGEKDQNKKAVLHTQTGTEDFLDKLIIEARELHSSDIHFEPFEDYSKVRVRIDGHLVERYRINKPDYPSLINRLKIRANLDIAEKRLPQDGRLLVRHFDQQFDIRVSILPTMHGEKAVLRLLSRDGTQIDLESLGFSENQQIQYREEIKKNQGIVLISGPTGSGKTTTLYATLKILNRENCNILTIEDPIEYTIEGINQVQLKESIGLTFSSALRTFLRQDPDIIMLGEIRDTDTAQMAIRAALTGHLVLSTIHTNSAWGTISRLIDMNIPAFLVAGTLNMSIAQRLVRLLCPKCKIKVAFRSHELPRGFFSSAVPENTYTAVGCESCYFTGYKGRKAIYEVIPIDDSMQQKIRAGHLEMDDILLDKGVQKLSDQAFQLVFDGETSLKEVYSILMNDVY